MSGHSHWAGIKHKKTLNDQKRAKEFTKVARLITVAARDGGKDPATNHALRAAVEKARIINMPNDNIERAIKRGAGDAEGTQFEESIMEAYGPGGAAILIKIITDNKNRTLGEIRNALARHHGKLVEGGSVQWLFEPAVIFSFSTTASRTKDELELAIIDAGAKETDWQDNYVLLAYCAPSAAESFRKTLEKFSIVPNGVEYAMKAKTDIAISPQDQQTLRILLEDLDEHDDVQMVYTNALFNTEQ